MSKYPKLALVLITFSACSYFQSGLVESEVQITGNIEATEVRLAFKTPGTIVELPVEEGEFVKKGDLVARLDADQLESSGIRQSPP